MAQPPNHGGTILVNRASGRNRATAYLQMGWLLVAVLVPLGVNLWAHHPFEPPKAALLRTLVWVMVGLWLWDSLQARLSPWRDLRHNALLWPVLALAGMQVLATLVAEDWRLSLWGSYERSQGTLTQLSYLLLFLIVSARLRTVRQARRLVLAMAATGVPLVVLGCAQALGWNPARLVTDARSPVYATLGRSNFLGAYLAMLLPLTLALAFTTKGRWKQLAGGALAFAEAVVVGLTLARGTWLAAAVAAAIFGLLWFWPRLTWRWRRTALAGGLAGLGVGLGGVLWLGSGGGSTAARLTIWRATLELIARHPLLGYGPDTLGLVFPRVYPPELVYYQGRGITIDRAHNLLLDWTVTTGVLGLLAGLSVLAAFFLLGWRAMQQTTEPGRRGLIVGCLAAIGGNTIGNLVSFDVTATAAATWLLMALTVALATDGRLVDRDEPARQSGSPWPRGATTGLLVVILAVVGVAIYQANARPQAADVAAGVADQRLVLDDREGAVEAGEKAVAFWPPEPAHRLSLSWATLQLALSSSRDPLPWLERAESELLAARDLRPGDHRTWAALGELYGLWGNRWDAEKLPLAHAAYEQATALAPHHAMLYTGWGLVELEGGRFAGAAARFRQAVDLDATDGFAFSYLGDVELAQGEVNEALAAYLEAVHWEPELSYAHLGLARCYWRLGYQEAARLALEEALRIDPYNAAALALRGEIEQGP